MKTALAYALILGSFAIGVPTSPAAPRRCVVQTADAQAQLTYPAASRYPAPVAERLMSNGSKREGLLLRVTTAPDPVQMINPLAPPNYGSGRGLVEYSSTQIHRDANPNIRQSHADGLRLWSMRDFW